MENYIINNKTIALIKNNKKTIIIDVNNIRLINRGIKIVLNHNCMLNGKNLDSIKKYGQYYLREKYKIPIIINKNIILIQIYSLRNKNSILLVTNKIIDYEEMANINFLKVKCLNNYLFYVNISKRSLEKLILNSVKLNNKLK